MIKKYLLLLPLLFAGCAMQTKNVRVLTSKTEINVKHISLEDNDTMICDPEGCKVMR